MPIARRGFYLVFALEILLGGAHLLWPHYRWGQGRNSYFHFDHALTAASWLASVQLAGAAFLSIALFAIRSRTRRRSEWTWLTGAALLFLLSLAEITRFPQRLGWSGPQLYWRMLYFGLAATALLLFGSLVLSLARPSRRARRALAAWVGAWGLQWGLALLAGWRALDSWSLTISLFRGWAYLFGATFLLLGLGEALLAGSRAGSGEEAMVLPLEGGRRSSLLGVVAGTTFVVVVLQIVLFRLLNIFADYLTATSVISVALLGIAAGGLIGLFRCRGRPLEALLRAAFLLPWTIVLALAAVVALGESPVLVSLFVALPFICCGAIITVVLGHVPPERVYGFDLVGAALGALLVGLLLALVREEGSLILLGAVGFLLAAALAGLHPHSHTRVLLLSLAFSGAVAWGVVGSWNLSRDGLNVVREKVHRQFPRAQILYSRSNFVGRYDVVRRRPGSHLLKGYEQGRTIDTIRRDPVEHYQIDPRLPDTLMERPRVLIIGLSGDGVIKNARRLGGRVDGVEINPAIVRLQRHELVAFNGDSYHGVDVSVIDGRNFLAGQSRTWDIITLMNAHFSRGQTRGRAPNPEYLHTREAVAAYLDHLSEKGVLVVEEPIVRPAAEVPVWKFLLTMREVLRSRGAAHPERHFFIFQWKTTQNNYVQILMKKTPFRQEEVARLLRWMRRLDRLRTLEAKVGRRLGPIRCRTTLLHSPDQPLGTLYARLLRGGLEPEFLRAHNLRPATDDRPFMFDVNPSHTPVLHAAGRSLLMLLLLAPFFLLAHRSGRGAVQSAPALVVSLLTGLAYLLVEVVLIQDFTIFLGSPTVTFAAVVGTLLLFSGLGSLWSGRLGARGVYCALGGLVLLLFLFGALPAALPWAALWSFPVRVAGVMAVLAPLAFLMGVPFPYILRQARREGGGGSPIFLFSLNAAASALAIPLAYGLAMSFGFGRTLQAGLLLYAVVAGLLVALERPRIWRPAAALAAAVLVVLLAAPWVGRPHSFREQVRIYALQYGVSTYRADRVLLGASSSRRLSFAWLFWLIRAPERIVLVDTGVGDPFTARERGIHHYVRPVELLARVGIQARQVTDIILTHAHWDHMGGLAPFSRARIWIQEKEYQYAARLLAGGADEAAGVRRVDWELLRASEKYGRLKRLRGSHALLPGVRLAAGGAHTPGFQYVRVRQAGGEIVIAGDASYLYRNNQWHRPVGTVVDALENLQALEEMQRLALSPYYILPGHDPRVLRWFPRVAAQVAEIRVPTG